MGDFDDFINNVSDIDSSEDFPEDDSFDEKENNEVFSIEEELDKFAEDMEDMDEIVSVEYNPFFNTPIEELIVPDEVFETQLAAIEELDKQKEEDAFNPQQETDPIMEELWERIGLKEEEPIEIPEQDKPVLPENVLGNDDKPNSNSIYDGLFESSEEEDDDNDESDSYYDDLDYLNELLFSDDEEEESEGYGESDIPFDVDDTDGDAKSVDNEPYENIVPKSEPKQEVLEDKDPTAGKMIDECTEEEIRAHFDWVKRQRVKKESGDSKPVTKSEPIHESGIRKETGNPDMGKSDSKSEKSSSEEPEKQKPRFRNPLKNPISKESRKIDEKEKLKKVVDEKRKSGVVPDVDNVVSDTETNESVRAKATARKLEIVLDDILLEIDKFVQNGEDKTIELKKEIEELDNKNKALATKLNINKEPKPEENDPQPEEKDAVRDTTPEETEEENPEETQIVAASNNVPGVQGKEDKYNEDIEKNNAPVNAIRAYTNGAGEVPQANYGKPKENMEDTKMPQLFFAGITVLVGIFAGVKANSYYNFKSLKKYHPDFTDVLWHCFFTDSPTSLTPFNAGIFFGAFIIIATILAVVGVSSFTKIKQKKESKIGHEHGNARLANSQDFMEFKKQFMDMSLSRPVKKKQK